MRRRLYWLLPDVASARRVVDDLLLQRVEERHMHFVAREGTDMSGLHPANVLQTSDLVRAAQFGMIVGGATGGLSGAVLAWVFADSGQTPAVGLIGAMAIAGALFGAWAASMIGVSVPSQRLRRFQPVIEQGQVLLMVDVPKGRVEPIEAYLQRTHPEAHLEGLEPNIPAFP